MPHLTKLTDDQVLDIRASTFSRRGDQAKLAESLNVTRALVNRIVKGTANRRVLKEGVRDGE